MEYIAKEIVYGLLDYPGSGGALSPTLQAVRKAVEKLPSADVVSRVAFEQVVWERNMAIEQLRNDYGVGLGQKKPTNSTETQ